MNMQPFLSIQMIFPFQNYQNLRFFQPAQNKPSELLSDLVHQNFLNFPPEIYLSCEKSNRFSA